MPRPETLRAPSEQDHTGVLLAVVGPSGAGKDSLIAYARRRLAADPSILFVRRIVTRTAVASAEDHEALTEEAFAEAKGSGAFAVTWKAHGLSYGIPAATQLHLASGGLAVVNGSRAALQEIYAAFGRVVTIHITCDPGILASRLAARQRESQADIQRRLERASARPSFAGETIEIDNSGDLTVAGEALVQVIERLAVTYRAPD